MSDKSLIQWTESTWNPVRGCTKISPGCKHCYAETFAERFRGVPGHPYEQGFDLRLVPEKLDEPLRWKKARRVFVNSMSDVFHDGVPFDYIAAMFGIMAAAERHTFQLLTKRPERMLEFFAWVWRHRGQTPRSVCSQTASQLLHRRWDFAMRQPYWPLPNVWLGVSVEDRRYGLPRIDHLRGVPAAVRFLSIEPLLEDLGEIDLTGIHWVIIGGESGRRARPFDLAWPRSIVRQCKTAGVPPFVKQLGANPMDELGPLLIQATKGDDQSEWPDDLRVRQMPGEVAL